jgi:hypothetical protein
VLILLSTFTGKLRLNAIEVYQKEAVAENSTTSVSECCLSIRHVATPIVASTAYSAQLPANNVGPARAPGQRRLNFTCPDHAYGLATRSSLTLYTAVLLLATKLRLKLTLPARVGTPEAAKPSPANQ